MALSQDASNDQYLLVGTKNGKPIAESFADFASATTQKKAYEARGDADLYLSFLPKAIHVA